ncbi:MerR family transcriptional regulator [Nocardia otitidiscaviarum]|nr:MerR family transcriptional regulator [Nocardia otitidiscaviarum]MBF6487431.1 MerR family transcriptional regulator [Nocardia otitidiscaviarum]
MRPDPARTEPTGPTEPSEATEFPVATEPTEVPVVTEYTVGSVAKLLGLPVATLRSWNQRYGLGPQRHRPGRHRHYTTEDVAVVTRMVELVRAGASPVSAARAAKTVLGPAPPLGDVAPVVAAAERMDVSALLSLVTAHLAHHGVVETWNRLCRPAFGAIVERQRRGDGYIDVEHVLSWALTTGLHHTVPALTGTARQRPIVLACAAAEQHVLPLEVLRAALAERGRPTLMLGAAVPADALLDALARRAGPAVVVLWSQTSETARPESMPNADNPAVDLVLAGPGWAGKEFAHGVRHVDSLEAALAVLDELSPADRPRR